MIEILIAVLVLLVVALIFYNVVVKPRERKRKIRALLAESNGTFDTPAQSALESVNDAIAKEPSPQLLATRGRILGYNLLDGGRGNDRDQRLQFGQAARDYERAVRGLRMQVMDQTMDDEMPPMFIMQQVRGFNDMFQGEFMEINRDDPEEWEIAQIMGMLNNTINEHGPAVHRDIVTNNVQRAVAGTSNRAEAVAAALAPTIVNDQQNVHDSKVNGDLNETLARIRCSVNRKDMLTEIAKYISDEYLQDDMKTDIARAQATKKRTQAKYTLDTMARGEYISTYKDTEDNILAMVWARCGNSRNATNSDLMREAVVNALADAGDNGVVGGTVCINGRCARVLSSLSLLDYDPTVGTALTFTAYRAQIMQETKEIFDNALDNAKTSDDPLMRGVAKSYEDINATADAEREAEFKAGIKDSIDKMLENYATKFNPGELNRLREECYVYATL